MAELMQLIETLDAQKTDVRALFSANPGETRVQRGKNDPRYVQKLAAAARFTAEVMQGRRRMWELREALSTSDFPYLFGDTIDRLMLQEYQEAPSDWRRFLRVSSVADFRSVKRFKMSDGDQRLTQVAEGTNYPHGDRDEAYYTFSVNKYGRVFRLTWETLVNDDLDALRSLPSVMARAAKRTEDYYASSLYVANSTLYSTSHTVGSTTYSNKGTAALTVSALKTAYQTMATYKDENDEPIFNRPRFLVVPPELELIAREIVGSMQLVYSGGDATTGVSAVAFPTQNVLAGRLEVLVDPYIPVLDSTNGSTSWYLFADPRDGHAAEVAFLRGYEAPQLYMKSASTVPISGTGGGALDGDFDTDAIWYKVRMVIGGSHANAVGGWRFSYWSDGTA